MKSSENAWKAFENTGKVEAYLSYKQQAAKETPLPNASGGAITDEAENRRHRPAGLQNRR